MSLVTFLGIYFVREARIDLATVGVAFLCENLLRGFLAPLFGALSDRIGRRTSMLWFGGLATLCTVPILHALGGVTSPYSAFALVIAALAIVSFYTSISGLIKAEMFPPEIRALGVGFSYALGNAIFGGSAEYVALWLKSAGIESSFYWYVTAMCAIAFIVCMRMRDPSKVGYLRDVP
jgi:MHS family alpha-ketoglutarate permease-like MFS transporter